MLFCNSDCSSTMKSISLGQQQSSQRVGNSEQRANSEIWDGREQNFWNLHYLCEDCSPHRWALWAIVCDSNGWYRRGGILETGQTLWILFFCCWPYTSAIQFCPGETCLVELIHGLLWPENWNPTKKFCLHFTVIIQFVYLRTFVFIHMTEVLEENLAEWFRNLR